MPIPSTPRNLPSLKYFLFCAFNDLRYIESGARGYTWPIELSQLEKAVLILEDRKFLRHPGFDIRSLLREFLKRITFRKHGGASTIEMQFVRTCTGYRERTLKRKLFETYLACALCHRMSKLAILRSYLAIAYFGSGLTGSEITAHRLFGVHPDELDLEQATVIASLLVYPRPLAPTEKWVVNVNRRAAYGARLISKYGNRYWT